MVAVGLPEPTRSASRRSRATRGRRAAGRVLPMVPAFALLALFFLGPILWCVYASFTDIALTGATASTPHLVGLRNYRRMFDDPQFRQSLWITVVFVLGSAVIGQNVGGMILALLMKSRRRIARAVVGAIVVGAWVMPELVAGFVWYAFLSDDGTLNAILHAVGLHGKSWLYATPLLSVTLANIWRGTAFSMLVYSAALSNVPEDLLEAAAVDGASALPAATAHHAAADAPRDDDQPDDDHAADPGGVHPDLRDDRRRARHQDPDAADLHVPVGVQVLPARLRCRAGHRAARRRRPSSPSSTCG